MILITLKYSSPVPSLPRRNSLHYDLASYEVQRLLGLEELQQVFGENSPASEVAWERSSPNSKRVEETRSYENEPEQEGISCCNSELSTTTLTMRRKSLMLPGVARRSSTLENAPIMPDQLKGKSSVTTPDYTGRTSFAECYDKSEVLDFLIPTHITASDQPRVETPCEDNYRQTGAFKLGSLRIVNGTASPSPMTSPSQKEVKADKISKQGINRDNSISKRRNIGESKFLLPKVRAEEKKGLEGTKPLPQSPPTALKSLSNKTIALGSPTRVLQDNSTPLIKAREETDEIMRSGTTKFSSFWKVKRKADKRNFIAASPMRIELSLDDIPPLELDMFALSPDSSENIKTNSKRTVIKDNLFDDQNSDSFSPGPEVLDVRSDPTAKSSRPTLPLREHRLNNGCSWSSSLGEDSTHRSSGISATSSKLTKADSGYGSSVSLQSSRGSGKRKKTAGNQSQIPENSSKKRDMVLPASSFRMQRSTNIKSPIKSIDSNSPSPLDTESLPPPVPEKDYVPMSSTPNVNFSRLSRTSLPHMGFMGSQRRNLQTTSPTTGYNIATEYLHPNAHTSKPNMQIASPSSMVIQNSQSTVAATQTSKKLRQGRLQKLLGSSGIRSRNSNSDHSTNKAPDLKIPATEQNNILRHLNRLSITAKSSLSPRFTRSKDMLMTSVTSAIHEDGTPENINMLTTNSPTTKIPAPSVSGTKMPNINISTTNTPITSITNVKQEHKNDSERQKPLIKSSDRPPNKASQRKETRRPLPPLSHRNTIHGSAINHIQRIEAQNWSYYNNPTTSHWKKTQYSPSEEPRRFAASVGRTLSMSSSTVEREIHMRVAAKSQAYRNEAFPSRSSSMVGYQNLSGYASAPSPTAVYHQSRSMSMTGSLRVPPSLSRKNSQEVVQSTEGMWFSPPSRNNSRTSMRSSASGAQSVGPYIGHFEGFSRSNSINSESGGADWQSLHLRRGSLSSYSDVDGYPTSSCLPWAADHHMLSPQKSLYDIPSGAVVPATFGTRSSYEARRQNMAPESWAKKHTIYNTVDPWYAAHIGYGPAPLSRNQYEQYASMQGKHALYNFSPRGGGNQHHQRPVPYRILHSYNSPAYRGVPIWG